MRLISDGFTAGRTKEDEKENAKETRNELLPIFGSGSRHNRWCHDKDGVARA